jgi:hypothetical protein
MTLLATIEILALSSCLMACHCLANGNTDKNAVSESCDSSSGISGGCKQEKKPAFLFEQSLEALAQEVNHLPTLIKQDKERVDFLMNALEGKKGGSRHDVRCAMILHF